MTTQLSRGKFESEVAEILCRFNLSPYSFSIGQMARGCPFWRVGVSYPEGGKWSSEVFDVEIPFGESLTAATVRRVGHSIIFQYLTREKTPLDESYYGCDLRYGLEEHEWIAESPEFNFLAIGKTRAEALGRFEEALKEVIEIHREKGQPLPAPHAYYTNK